MTACNGIIEIGIEHSPQPAGSEIVPGQPEMITQTLETSPQPSATTQISGPLSVKIFLIAVGDNGISGNMVGCGDSVIPVDVEIVPTTGVLNAALVELLSLKDQFYGQSGLYNSLYQSDLEVESVRIDGGKASVYLTGTLLMGGECDSPRVQAQIEQTILQFANVSEAAIYINGKSLADVLSLK